MERCDAFLRDFLDVDLAGTYEPKNAAHRHTTGYVRGMSDATIREDNEYLDKRSPWPLASPSWTLNS